VNILIIYGILQIKNSFFKDVRILWHNTKSWGRMMQIRPGSLLKHLFSPHLSNMVSFICSFRFFTIIHSIHVHWIVLQKRFYPLIVALLHVYFPPLLFPSGLFPLSPSFSFRHFYSWPRLLWKNVTHSWADQGSERNAAISVFMRCKDSEMTVLWPDNSLFPLGAVSLPS